MDAEQQRPPDWRLPPGVSPGLWEYLHSKELAAAYDGLLADSPLFGWDQGFVTNSLPHPCRVLDLGCGTGRHLLPLAALGFDCVGVDLSKAMLEMASQKLREQRLAARLVRANLVEMDCLADGHFDVCLCMFSTLGMIRGANERRRVVEHAHRLLRDGGRFLLHVHNR